MRKAAGRAGVVARYDVASSSWVTLAQVIVPVGMPVEFADFVQPGQFALLVPDQGDGAPAVAPIGQPLPAGTSGAIPVDAQAAGKVTPPVGRADYLTPAVAAVDVTGATSLRSGSLLRGDFMEVFVLRGGGQVAPLDTSQDFVAYRSLEDPAGKTLVASFPIAPSRTFGAAQVTEGFIDGEALTSGGR